MPTDACTLVEICSLSDPLLLPWLDLYEIAFPLAERFPVSRILNVLHEQARGASRGQRLLAAVPSSSLIGDRLITDQRNPSYSSPLTALFFTYEPPDLPAAFLWYFAVQAEQRGQGLGSQLYRSLLARLGPEVRALIFDLEDPRQMETRAEQELARRRVGFYRRLGARLLGGVDYVQCIAPHLPPLPLLLMVHPIQEISPQEAFDLAKAAMPEAVNLAGELGWLTTDF
jgi:ribosomal protein S18 acetylase RimI-like enzyme